jgi:SAM-dependent methyltransferase
MAVSESLYDNEQSFGSAFARCIACGSDHIGPWRTKSFAATAKSDIRSFAIYRCAACGTGFLNPPPSASYLRKVYAVSGHGLTKPISLEEVEEAERVFPNATVDADRMARVADASNRSGSRRALDIGAGYGFGSRALMRRGYAVTAINPSALEGVVFQAMNGFPPVAQMFEDYSPEGCFGVVYLSQVLEHVVDPLPTLERIADCLEPGGAVVIAVPNFQSLMVKILGTRDNSCLWVPEHVNYFTTRGLIALLHQAGLRAGASINVSRIRYDALSRRLHLRGQAERAAQTALKWLQRPPLFLADRLGWGIYLNIVATKP